MLYRLLPLLSLLICFSACSRETASTNNPPQYAPTEKAASVAATDDNQAATAGQGRQSEAVLPKTDEQWREILTPLQFEVTREKGTEPPRTGEYWDCKKDGTYVCVCCGLPLFASATKYESGTGWPSFWEPVNEESVETRPDYGLFTSRTEVICSRCDAHLGHVFDDGPDPTGLRYCMNSAALRLVEEGTEESTKVPSAIPEGSDREAGAQDTN